jgi:hypothetical protein
MIFEDGLERDGADAEYPPRTDVLKVLKDKIYIHTLPSYGNKIFFALGFLTLTSLLMLIVSGVVLAFMGQQWWLSVPLGIYARSVHLWSVQAFIFLLIMHFLVVLATGGYRPPRRMVWVFGAIIFCLALIQTEFGYGLRGDFASQFRAVSGADFWNGAYIGYWLNPLNYTQSFVIHVAIIPLAILGLFAAHYLLEHAFGISKPYRADVKYTMVAADHRAMYRRGVFLAVLILGLALFFHSPYVPAVKIADVARTDPGLVATTLVAELDHSSDTATYLDSIDPYTFDTAQVFVQVPYQQLAASSGGPDAWQAYSSESSEARQADLAEARAFTSSTDPQTYATSTNPVIAMLKTLVPAARSGLYESIVSGENPSINSTYTLRFLSDMSVPEGKASTLNMDTEQWGMIKDETGSVWGPPPGSWWFLPLALSNSIFDLPNNPNGDRIAGEILGCIMLIFISFPYIPYLNRLPEKLNIAPLIWK